MTAGGYARRDARGMSGGPELVMTRAGATAESRAASCRGMNGVKAAATPAAGMKSATVKTASVEAASAPMKATPAAMKSAPAVTSTAVTAATMTSAAASIGAACEQRGRCRDCKDRGERQHGVFATGGPQHFCSPPDTQ
ncbi:MAG TPA: hypothetical protein VF583_12305 [Bradyrhizobium sp.]